MISQVCFFLSQIKKKRMKTQILRTQRIKQRIGNDRKWSPNYSNIQCNFCFNIIRGKSNFCFNSLFLGGDWERMGCLTWYYHGFLRHLPYSLCNLGSAFGSLHYIFVAVTSYIAFLGSAFGSLCIFFFCISLEKIIK